MQPRDTDRLESVVQEIIELIGALQAGHEVGLGKTSIYNAASEDNGAMLSIDAFLKLDRVCLERHSVAPFKRWWERQLDKDDLPDGQAATCVFSAALGLQQAVGMLSGAVVDAKAPDSHGGQRITRREAVAIKRLTKDTRDMLDTIDRAVDAERDGEGHLTVISDLQRERRQGGGR